MGRVGKSEGECGDRKCVAQEHELGVSLVGVEGPGGPSHHGEAATLGCARHAAPPAKKNRLGYVLFDIDFSAAPGPPLPQRRTSPGTGIPQDFAFFEGMDWPELLRVTASRTSAFCFVDVDRADHGARCGLLRSRHVRRTALLGWTLVGIAFLSRRGSRLSGGRRLAGADGIVQGRCRLVAAWLLDLALRPCIDLVLCAFLGLGVRDHLFLGRSAWRVLCVGAGCEQACDHDC